MLKMERTRNKIHKCSTQIVWLILLGWVGRWAACTGMNMQFISSSVIMGPTRSSAAGTKDAIAHAGDQWPEFVVHHEVMKRENSAPKTWPCEAGIPAALHFRPRFSRVVPEQVFTALFRPFLILGRQSSKNNEGGNASPKTKQKTIRMKSSSLPPDASSSTRF